MNETTFEEEDQDAALWDGRGIVNTPDGPTTATDNDW